MMGLLQKAVETYDHFESLAGIYREGHEVLAPIAHATTSADLEITLDADGNIIDAKPLDKSEPKTVFPVTEKSVGRSSGACAHPLCDKIDYLSGKNEEKYNLYLDQLQNWTDSEFTHPMLKPILTYVKKKTILNDLGHYKFEKVDDKSFVRWRVVGIGDQSGGCWDNKALLESFADWYSDTISNDEKNICMITGNNEVMAKQHLKGIIPSNGNAKLISANDTTDFTYRGRFFDSTQTATISYTASQKAHNVLKWLASEQSVRVVSGGRTFLCWNPKGKKAPHVLSPFAKYTSETPSDYRQELLNTLNGYRNELPNGNGGVVICSFDAATTGRLSLTYYNELRESDFLVRLKNWDEHCCWWRRDFERNTYTIQSPTLYKIVNCAFGTQRTDNKSTKLVTDEQVLKQQLQRLISCRIDRMKFPTDIERLLVNRVSSRHSFEAGIYREILFVTCAVISKYRFDYFQEEISMALEPEKKDPSYQFGRLLAVLEKAENDTYGKDEGRETNAARMQSVYRQHPLHTANIIEEQLEKAYFPKLPYGSRIYYKNLIGEIMEILQEFPSAWNKQLGDTYLLGYYLQRRELYTSKTDKKSEGENK